MNLYITLASYIISAAVAAAGGFGAAWTLQELTIANIQLERKDERIAKDRAARFQAEQRVATNRAAELQAQGRMERLAAVADSNRTELERLRVITDATFRSASASLEACVAHAATQGLVFTQCASRLEEVGRAADGHVSDIKTLMESE